jgi:hypothetical protein
MPFSSSLETKLNGKQQPGTQTERQTAVHEQQAGLHVVSVNRSLTCNRATGLSNRKKPVGGVLAVN